MSKKLLIGMVCVALFGSCVHTAERSFLESSVPDYGETHAWITPFESQYPVDVFYVYPTVSHNESGNMDVMNEEDRALAQGIFAAQASLFQGNANIYAPYYRQMSTEAKVSDDPNVLATDLPEFKVGASDVQSAFRYYIEHLNQGRPFILAGHSQGSMALIELIKSEFGSDASLREQLVAAYLIGYTVTDEDLRISRLHAAEGADDTGVVITFNTQSPASVGGPMLLAGAHCINPLSWKTDDTPCEATLNKGAVFFNDATGAFLREEPAYCGATIDLETGALTTVIPDELEIGPYPEGVYHRYDYAFWYRNLEENVKTRIDAYMGHHSL